MPPLIVVCFHNTRRKLAACWRPFYSSLSRNDFVGHLTNIKNITSDPCTLHRFRAHNACTFGVTTSPPWAVDCVRSLKNTGRLLRHGLPPRASSWLKSTKLQIASLQRFILHLYLEPRRIPQWERGIYFGLQTPSNLDSTQSPQKYRSIKKPCKSWSLKGMAPRQSRPEDDDQDVGSAILQYRPYEATVEEKIPYLYFI